MKTDEICTYYMHSQGFSVRKKMRLWAGLLPGPHWGDYCAPQTLYLIVVRGLTAQETYTYSQPYASIFGLSVLVQF